MSNVIQLNFVTAVAKVRAQRTMKLASVCNHPSMTHGEARQQLRKNRADAVQNYIAMYAADLKVPTWISEEAQKVAESILCQTGASAFAIQSAVRYMEQKGYTKRWGISS